MKKKEVAMKKYVFFGIMTFTIHSSLPAVVGNTSNESIAEAWGLVTPEEIAEVENSQKDPHKHHHEDKKS